MITRRLQEEVTLICADCVNIGTAIDSLELCRKQVGFKHVVFCTSADCNYPHVVKISPLRSAMDYSYFIIKQLYRHFHTPHCLIVQHDSHITDPEAWTDEFLEFDYIGCKSPRHQLYSGNGGFSLRSYNLMRYASKHINDCHNEDIVLSWNGYSNGQGRRPELEAAGFRFADDETMSRFGWELVRPNVDKIFGQHRVSPSSHPRYNKMKKKHLCGEIESATYGSSSQTKDVTALITLGILNVNNDTFGGDPHLGQQKTLVVKLKSGDTYTFAEKDVVHIVESYNKEDEDEENAINLPTKIEIIGDMFVSKNEVSAFGKKRTFAEIEVDRTDRIISHDGNAQFDEMIKTETKTSDNLTDLMWPLMYKKVKITIEAVD